MPHALDGSPLLEGIGAWLLQQGMREASVTDVAQGVGRRLLAGGVPLYRVSIGGMVLHPVFGAMNVAWDADTDHAQSAMVPREEMTSDEFRNAPFYRLLSEQIEFYRQRLDEPAERDFPLFERLRAQRVTDYFAFFRSYGRTDEVKWADLPPGVEGVLGSFSTRRIGGFTDFEIDYLKALSLPMALAVKSTTTYQLASALLDAYLGRYSGGHVLDGAVERGDGRLIDCVLWYCDLRGSTALAEELTLDRYLETLDDYFEYTAGAVIDHGGEVLKFIGDAVMAIFPVDPVARPRIDMCRAAMMAARDALSRAERGNAARERAGLPPIRFGISLHVGEVMYGNVGTRRRLDFTVTGPAVNEAARLEGLCKVLGTPVATSSRYRDAYPGPLVSLGAHSVPGKRDTLEVFTAPELAPPGGGPSVEAAGT
ncbi:MAG: adenylate/guanylate cyclase domain-containing protein [Alphaproteobacteria bacterium]